MRFGNVNVPVLLFQCVESHLEIRVAAEKHVQQGEDGEGSLRSCSSRSASLIMFWWPRRVSCCCAAWPCFFRLSSFVFRRPVTVLSWMACRNAKICCLSSLVHSTTRSKHESGTPLRSSPRQSPRSRFPALQCSCECQYVFREYFHLMPVWILACQTLQIARPEAYTSEGQRIVVVITKQIG
jgi:hypothetical protein